MENIDINLTMLMTLLLGVIVGLLRQAPQVIFIKLIKLIFRSSTISARDEAFIWISLYMWQNCSKAFLRHTDINTNEFLWQLNNNDYTFNRNTKSIPTIYSKPSIGIYPIKFNNKRFFINFHYMSYTDKGISVREERISIFTFGFSNRQKYINDFIIHCYSKYQQFKDNRKSPILYTPNLSDGIYWSKSGTINFCREHLIGNKIEIDKLFNDVLQFLDQREEYLAKGIPYKRSYALYGPPGTGKTSLGKALATTFRRDVYQLILSDEKMSDSALLALVRRIISDSNTWPPILVIEDIDKAFKGRDSLNTSNTLSFSGLINTLDGLMELNDLIIIITTNHIEQLDPALLRPGRIDYRMEMPYMCKEDAQDYVKFLIDHTSNLDFINSSNKITPSLLRGAVMRNFSLKKSQSKFDHDILIKSINDDEKFINTIG